MQKMHGSFCMQFWEVDMGAILALAGGIPTGILLISLIGCALAIRSARDEMIKDMQNEKGGSRHGFW